MDEQGTIPPAGWYADPGVGPGGMRWWDGVQWTTHVHQPNAAAAAAANAATTPSADQAHAPATPALHEQGYQAVIARRLEEERAAMKVDPEVATTLRNASLLGAAIGSFIGFFGWLVTGGLLAPLPIFVVAAAAGGWFVGPLVRRAIIERGAKAAAHRSYMSSWAAARGWAFQHEFTPWDDVPLLRQGDQRESEGCLSGELWPGVPGHIYNYTYIVVSSDSDGGTNRTYYRFTVLRAEVPLGLPQLQVRPRAVAASRVFDRLKGGVTSRRPVKLESMEFERSFVLEVDDAADEVAVRTLFDPVLITHCIASGKRFPALQANREAIVFAKKDHYDPSDANGLAELDEMIACVRPTIDRMVFNMRNFGAAGVA